MRLTNKQKLLLKAICKGSGDGSPPDLDQILDNLEYETSKESLQFSIRKLIAKGLIEKRDLEHRRGQYRRVISLTKKGYEVYAGMI